MAKSKAKPKDDKIPRLAQPTHPVPYYANMKPREEEKRALELPRLEKRSYEQVINGFKMLSRGWSGGVEAALSVPPELFFFEGVNSRFYSSDERAELGGMLRGLGMGKLIHPNTDYGIVLYETSSTIYLVLFDAKRRIAVREPLLCYHNTPPEREWSKVQKSIEAATALAAADDAKKRGLFALYDGTLRLVAPEKEALTGAPPQVA